MAEDNKPKTEYEGEKEAQTGQGDGKRQRRRGGGPSSILAPGEKPKNFRKAIKDTLSYMGGYKFAIAVVIVVSALATIFETVGPKVMGRATTLLAEGVMNKIHGTGGIDFGDRGYRQGKYGEEAYDTEAYSLTEIERIGRVAF